MESGVFLVTAKNIRQGYIDYESSKEYVSLEDYEEVMRRGKPKLGDVLITTEAPLGNVASIDREDIALAQRVIKFRGKKNILDSCFLKHYFIFPDFQKKLNDNSTGSTAKGIKGSVLHKMCLGFPTLSEQTKIANFLTAVDDKLTQLKKKKSLLEQYKKGVMQKLFSQELRFKDENGEDFAEWEEKKLGEIIEITSGFPFQSEMFNEVGQKLVTPKNFTKYGYGVFTEGNTKHTSETPAEKFLCKSGDLLLLLTDLTQSCELLGKPLMLTDNDGEVLLNQRVIKINVKNRALNKVFLMYFFLTDECHKIFKETASGSTVKHSSNKIVLGIDLPLPSFPEQAKIANFVSAIDDKINNCCVQIEKTEGWKKGLLQKMFV